MSKIYQKPAMAQYKNREIDLKEKGLFSDYPLSGLNSWKVGGPADFFCRPKNKEDLLYSLQWAKQKNLPVNFLGGGTNVLISDKGAEGLTIHLTKLSAFHEWEEEGRLRVRALTGLSKAKLMQIFLRHKLAPALFLCGLPGDVGGGLVMNAGVGQDIFPREFKDIVDWLKVIETGEVESGHIKAGKAVGENEIIRENKPIIGKDEVVKNSKVIKNSKTVEKQNNIVSDKQDPFTLIKKDKIKWGYRFSEGWGPGLIYEVAVSWPLKPLPDLPIRLKEMALKRSGSQPLQSASCGSVFKNPLTGEKAGALIEQCGLKGRAMGKARVSEKHANFIVNTGGATAGDIHRLIQYVQNTVRDKHDVLLEPEVRYMGRW